MSKINKLIAQLCPNGLEYHKLGELGQFYGGLSGKSKDDFSGGKAKLITYMNVFSNIALALDVDDKVRIGENEKQNTVQFGDVLFTASSETLNECGMSSVLVTETDALLYLNSFCFGFRLADRQLLNPAFSKYLFRSTEIRKQIIRTANGVTRFNVSKEKMKQVAIPIPPLPVQQEIVRILDNFTHLTAELTAELTARQSQYEYYRDKLLTFDGDINWVKLEDIAVIKNGSTYKNFNEGTIPVYGTGGIMTYVDTFAYDKPTVLIPRKGSIDKLYYVDEPFWNVDTIFYTEINDELIEPKFLYYFLQTERLENLNIAGGVPSLTQTMLKLVKIPLPPLAEQARIVSILDKFDALVNDLSSGIPAEIEARQKQYEYYRDRLLTFKEKVS